MSKHDLMWWMQQLQQLVCLAGKRGIAGISVCQQHVQQLVCIVVSSGCCRCWAVQARPAQIFSLCLMIEHAEHVRLAVSDVSEDDDSGSRRRKDGAPR